MLRDRRERVTARLHKSRRARERGCPGRRLRNVFVVFYELSVRDDGSGDKLMFLCACRNRRGIPVFEPTLLIGRLKFSSVQYSTNRLYLVRCIKCSLPHSAASRGSVTRSVSEKYNRDCGHPCRYFFLLLRQIYPSLVYNYSVLCMNALSLANRTPFSSCSNLPAFYLVVGRSAGET